MTLKNHVAARAAAIRNVVVGGLCMSRKRHRNTHQARTSPCRAPGIRAEERAVTSGHQVVARRSPRRARPATPGRAFRIPRTRSSTARAPRRTNRCRVDHEHFRSSASVLEEWWHGDVQHPLLIGARLGHASNEPSLERPRCSTAFARRLPPHARAPAVLAGTKLAPVTADDPRRQKPRLSRRSGAGSCGPRPTRLRARGRDHGCRCH